MAITPYKTFVPGEILTAADLNLSFTTITANALSLISPLTGTLDADGEAISMDEDADLKLQALTDDVLSILLGATELFKFSLAAASANNGLTFNAGTPGGLTPSIVAQGSPTNLNLAIEPKGTGVVYVGASGAGGQGLIIDSDRDLRVMAGTDDILDVGINGVLTTMFRFHMAAASIVNGLLFRGVATGAKPSIEAQGSDTHISIELIPKGANGRVQVGTLLNDDAIDSQHYVDGSIDLVHLGPNTGGWVFITSQTSTNTATFDFTDLDDYDAYKFILSDVRSLNDVVNFIMRVDSDNGASFDAGGNYNWEAMAVSGGVVVGATGASDTSMRLAASMGNADNTEAGSFEVTMLHRGSGSSVSRFFATGSFRNSAAATLLFQMGGTWNVGNSVNAVRFLMSGGNIRGTIRVYGMRES